MFALPFRDVALVLAIAMCWAFNLAVVKFTIQEVSPLTLGCVRFFFVAFPLVFFLKRPVVPFSKMLAIGLTLGVAKFALLFLAIEKGLSIGLCALALQTQIIFTAIISYLFFDHKLSKREISGIGLALCGIVMLGTQIECGATTIGFLLAMLAALSWGISNNLCSTLKGVDMLELTVWMSLIPPIPYFLLSQVLEGPQVFFTSLMHLGIKEAGAIAYIVIIATLFGLTGWTWLMRQHNPTKCSIYGLLIPVFSLFFGWLCFNECLNTMSIFACVVVLLGLIVNQWPKSPPQVVAEEEPSIAA